MIQRRPTWKDFLEGFKKVDLKYIGLPIIIGGDKKLIDFKGFKTKGSVLARPMTGLDVLTILESIPETELTKEIPEEEFSGFDMLSIGVSNVCLDHIVWQKERIDHNMETGYFPLQESEPDGGRFPDDKTAEDSFGLTGKLADGMKTALIYREFVRPCCRLVIETIDGGCITKDEDFIAAY